MKNHVQQSSSREIFGKFHNFFKYFFGTDLFYLKQSDERESQSLFLRLCTAYSNISVAFPRNALKNTIKSL